jgi:hypothetical protein
MNLARAVSLDGRGRDGFRRPIGVATKGKEREIMKRIFLMLLVAAGLLVPSLVFVGNAGASPSGDPNASCGVENPCNSPGLTYSEGCQNGAAPSHNPHCVTTTTPTPTPTPTATPAVTPAGEKGARDKAAAETAQGGEPAQGGEAAGELAFTGVDAGWLALLGAAMLASGLALRARSRSSA